MRFILIDRVLKIERSKSIEACRKVSLSDDIFADHFPGNPIMPASLIIESFAQAATILLESSSEFRDKAVPGYISNAKFHRAVVPGHDLMIQMRIESVSEEAAVLSGIAQQRDKKCASITLGMVTTPLDGFIPGEFLRFYLSIYDFWLRDCELAGFERHPLRQRTSRES
jgi:3-hydroxyacyl-[acyl-carrier-protein] dehydratase